MGDGLEDGSSDGRDSRGPRPHVGLDTRRHHGFCLAGGAGSLKEGCPGVGGREGEFGGVIDDGV